MKPLLLATALLLPLAASAQVLPSPVDPMPPAAMTPAQIEGVGFDQKIGEKLPLDLRFRDEAGKEVRLGDYFGRRPVLLAFVYYRCPLLCSMVLNGVVTSLRPMTLEPGKDFDVVAISFDPADTPETAAAKRKAYVEDYGKPATLGGWHFLTGSPESIAAATAAAGFRYKWDPERQQFAHASGVVVVTPDGTMARWLPGIDYSSRALRLSFVEASQGKLGTLADAAFLYCFQYDPQHGRYGAMVMRMVRAGGLLTMLCLGAFVWASRRRDRKATGGAA